jgi:hypothetical protein
MGGRKKISYVKDRRLDIFIERIELEKSEKKEMLENVENLTFDVITGKSSPKLRLKKP